MDPNQKKIDLNKVKNEKSTVLNNKKVVLKIYIWKENVAIVAETKKEGDLEIYSHLYRGMTTENRHNT